MWLLGGPSASGEMRLATAQHEPIDFPIENAQDEILSHLVPPVNVQLGVQIETDAAGSDLRHQFRRMLDVVGVANLRLPAAFRFD